jgi:hypothetical protein
MILKYPWMYEYLSAFIETDNATLAKRIDVAEATIRARVDELSRDHGGTLEERAALANAIARLDKLIIERLGYY